MGKTFKPLESSPATSKMAYAQLMGLAVTPALLSAAPTSNNPIGVSTLTASYHSTSQHRSLSDTSNCCSFGFSCGTCTRDSCNPLFCAACDCDCCSPPPGEFQCVTKLEDRGCKPSQGFCATSQSCITVPNGTPRRFQGYTCRKNEDFNKNWWFLEGQQNSELGCENYCRDSSTCKAWQYSPTKNVCRLSNSEIEFVEKAQQSDTVCVVNVK